jgi:hypothetical protein
VASKIIAWIFVTPEPKQSREAEIPWGNIRAFLFQRVNQIQQPTERSNTDQHNVTLCM